MQLTEKEWMFLNDTALKIHTTEDFTEMRRTFLGHAQLLIPSDFSASFIRDKTGAHNVTDPIGLNFPAGYLDGYRDTEKDDFFKWTYSYSESRVYRGSDFLPAEVMECTSFYKQVYLPLDIYYFLGACLCHSGIFLGFAYFYRKKGGMDFTDREIFFMDVLKDHLAARFYREHTKHNHFGGEETPAVHELQSLAERYGLTKRELEILGLWHAGMTNKEMCQILYISENTLKKHIVNMYKKMGINSRIELLKLIQS